MAAERLVPASWFGNRPGIDLGRQLQRQRVVHDFTEQRRPEFGAIGHNQRSPFFPHSVRFVPKSGTDGLKLGKRMAGIDDPAKLWLVVLHAGAAELAEFPPDLFLDRDLIWHGQTLGLPGHIAYACVLEHDGEVVGLNYISDLVQRIGRRRAYKTRVEKFFRGWPRLLLNALMEFARLRGLRGVRSPTAELVMRHTAPRRPVLPELFERVYDRSVLHGFRARRDGLWWRIALADNQDRLVRPVRRLEPGFDVAPTVVLHDVGAERGGDALERILAVEARAGVRTTYSVVGCRLEELRRPIELAGHALAFGSFDRNPLRRQLDRCREKDYRLKGYRRPWSLPTPDTTPWKLCWFNFEWLAAGSLALHRAGFSARDRLVRIPIAADERAIVRSSAWACGESSQQSSRTSGLRCIVLRERSVDGWFPQYAALLSRLADQGPLWTADELANQLFLAEAV